jgi:hypothetical protein
MNPALHDNTWIGCGTSLLWDADALSPTDEPNRCKLRQETPRRP